MKTLEWTFLDRSRWDRGQWDREPIDKRQWRDEETGLACLIHRNPRGAWCGYVGVPKGHPAFEVPYYAPIEYDDDGDEIKTEETPGRRLVDSIDVHGGLTFDGFCQPHDAESGRGICHTVEDGEDDIVWWLGFDCNHSWDIAPDPGTLGRLWLTGYARYASQRYVEGEVRKLARQLGRTE